MGKEHKARRARPPQRQSEPDSGIKADRLEYAKKLRERALGQRPKEPEQFPAAPWSTFIDPPPYFSSPDVFKAFLTELDGMPDLPEVRSAREQALEDLKAAESRKN